MAVLFDGGVERLSSAPTSSRIARKAARSADVRIALADGRRRSTFAHVWHAFSASGQKGLGTGLASTPQRVIRRSPRSDIPPGRKACARRPRRAMTPCRTPACPAAGVSAGHPEPSRVDPREAVLRVHGGARRLVGGNSSGNTSVVVQVEAPRRMIQRTTDIDERSGGTRQVVRVVRRVVRKS